MVDNLVFLLVHCCPQECDFAKIKVIADTTNSGLFVESGSYLLWVVVDAAAALLVFS